jgi:hypothetical protein
MCNQHFLTRGKAAVVALVEAEFKPKSVCEARIAYLTKAVEGFRDWLVTQECPNPDEVITHIEENTRKLLRNPTDNEFIWSREHDLHKGEVDGEEVVDEHLTDLEADALNAKENRLDEEELMHQYYWMNLAQNCQRAFNKAFSEPPWIVEKWVEFMTKVQNVYYSNNNYLPKETWSACKKARDSMYRQRKLKAMSYEDWALLTNWVNRMMSSPKRYNIIETEKLDSGFDEDVALCYYETELHSEVAE